MCHSRKDKGRKQSIQEKEIDGNEAKKAKPLNRRLESGRRDAAVSGHTLGA